MFPRGPVLYPCYVTGYMLATSLLYVTELSTNRCCEDKQLRLKRGWWDNDYTSRRDVSMVNLTGAA